jgi:hypothetical protein
MTITHRIKNLHLIADGAELPLAASVSAWIWPLDFAQMTL